MLGQAEAMQDAMEVLEEAMAMPTEPVPPVPFATLIDYLPASVAGLEGGEPEGESASMGGFSFSTASRSYRDLEGAAGADVEIHDYAYIQALYAPFQMMMAMGFNRESTSGYERSIKVGDFDAYETWDQAGSNAEVTVMVGRRFIVQVSTWGLDEGVARAAAASIDLSELAGEGSN